MFTSLQEAISQMEAKFALAGRDVAPWPAAPGATEVELRETERRIGQALPDSFRSVVARYDFLNAVAGNVSMVFAESFTGWLVEPNVEPVPGSMLRWWGSGARPRDLLLIAQSDANTILLNLDSGEVSTISVDRRGDPPARIASSFALFYQGLASIYLANAGTTEAEAAAVAAAVGAETSSSFWSDFAVGAA